MTKNILIYLQKLSLLPPENRSHRDAHTSENIQKNRHTQIVPCKFSLYPDMPSSLLFLDDQNRVFLSRILGHPYINASFIKVNPSNDIPHLSIHSRVIPNNVHSSSHKIHWKKPFLNFGEC